MTELVEHLQARRRQLRAAVDAVPAALQRQPPAPGQWSVAEVVEHLGRVERQVAALLRRGFERARATLPRETEVSSTLAALDGARMLDRGRRLQAPPTAAPTEGLDVAAGWQRLEVSRADLLAVIASADGFAVGTIVAPHPLLGDHDFYQWLAFVGFHEARHAAQIAAIVAALRR